VNFRIYFLLSVTLLIIIFLSFLTTVESGFFKSALAHSITVPVRGAGPAGIAYNAANNNMYVANFGSSTVSVISGSTDSVITSILVGRQPAQVTYAPPNNKLYVSNAGSDDVYVINGANNKVTEHIPVGSQPFGIAYNPTNNDVYVVNLGNSTVSVIDTSIDSVIDTIALESVQPPNSD
jgi:YVTN family beta-propeller protein